MGTLVFDFFFFEARGNWGSNNLPLMANFLQNARGLKKSENSSYKKKSKIPPENFWLRVCFEENKKRENIRANNI